MKTAYPQTQATCSIRLYSNIPFDNTYQHHSLISDMFKYNNSTIYSGVTSSLLSTPKERFIDRKKKLVNEKYYPRYDMTGEYNFNFENGLLATVTLELTPAQTNANYMRLTCGSDVYYYFITGIKQVNFETYTLSLELDVLMTYQDEFLEGMRNQPVFTQRKHCHRYNDTGLIPHCADYKNGEDIFSGIKPSIITSVQELNYDNTHLKTIKDVKWLYICCDGLKRTTGGANQVLADAVYQGKGITHPMTILCFPLNVRQFAIYDKDHSNQKAFGNKQKKLMDLLINNGIVHGTKISNIPPFNTCNGSSLNADRDLTIDTSTVFTPYYDNGTLLNINDLYTFSLGNNEFVCMNNTAPTETFNLDDFLLCGCFIVTSQVDINFVSDDVKLNDFKNGDAPTIQDFRFVEPRLLFSPFTKYILVSKYASDGCELYPELVYSEYIYNYNTFDFTMYGTGYIGDNNFFTKINSVTIDGENALYGYNYAKIGLAGSVNYNLPAGTNALDVFNSTQAQAFYQSKTASGITSGLTIAGGVGSVALGVAGLVGTMGLSAPASAGLIAGGIGAVGSGVAGITNTIKSTNSKIIDLKNTPDSINISGSNFIFDDGVTDGSDLPYVILYECDSATKEKVADYFYNYGYQVARECYFNTEMKYVDANHKVDNNIFGRTIFNFVQLEEDITNKINADIPLIVKQKLSNIFRNGITLWSFFGMGGLWDNSFSVTTGTDPDRWFLKHSFDNTEYSQ